MAEPERWFKAGPLTIEEYNRIEDARREAERAGGDSYSNKEFLLLMANDTSGKWRKK